MVLNHLFKRRGSLIVGGMRFVNPVPVFHGILRKRSRFFWIVMKNGGVAELDAGLHDDGNHTLPCGLQPAAAKCFFSYRQRVFQLFWTGGSRSLRLNLFASGNRNLGAYHVKGGGRTLAELLVSLFG